MVSTVALTLLSSSIAFGQTNEAIAESLFHEGKKLYNEQRYAEACERLNQSHRADPAGGTVLLLAMCYEHQGRTASAWAKYSEALAMARRDGRADREQKAKEAMATLEPQLAYVSVTLDEKAKSLSDMEFVLDNTKIPLLVDAKVPVDPGEHVLVVKATDREPWTHPFTISGTATTVSVTVPLLDPVPKTAPLTTVAPTPQQPNTTTRTTTSTSSIPAVESKSSPVRTIGYLLGGAGIVATGVGGYFAWHARDLDKKADDRCPDTLCGDQKSVDYSKDATSSAKVATWLVGGGGAAIVTGAAMILFGGKSKPNFEASALILPNGGALSVFGRY